MRPAPKRKALLCLGTAALWPWLSATAAPVINEIMFHPPSAPGSAEDTGLEWLELHNPGSVPDDLAGWRLTKGVDFTIPAGTVLPSGGYMVIAADRAKFLALHPGFSGAVVGGWTGRLSNSGEEIQLDDAAGEKVDEVTYADEGDWALRARGEETDGHRGWVWESPADGEGRTLERRNAQALDSHAQNWTFSSAAGGTPGAVNSTASANIAPLIRDAHHKPEIPRSSEPIRISCKLGDDGSGATATATLHWRADGTAGFTTAAMTDADADGRLEATIPPQANLTVIEWYIQAAGDINTRTWPAPARTSNPGAATATFGQVTNALLQVDDSFDPARDFRVPGNHPVARLIMTAAERDELNSIQTGNGAQSEAAFNATFISHDGTGTRVVYNSGVRNRGLSSASGPPNNFSVGFRSDDRWKGRGSVQFNCQYSYSQVLGNTLFARAGIAPQEAAAAVLRVNGADQAQSGDLMFGRYAMLEGRNADWAEHHFPGDPDGNFYRLDDHAYPQGDARSGEFSWEGPAAEAYADTFIKETNKEANDYSDLIQLARVVSAPASGGNGEQPAINDADYPAAVAAVLDLDQFYKFIAVDALIGNQEGGLQSGRSDDASIYRGLIDTRFRFVPHDMDDVFDIGNGFGDPETRSIFSYNAGGGGVTGLARLFNHPQLVPRYYAALVEAMDTWFTPEVVEPLIDQIMTGWVPAAGGNTPRHSIEAIKAFVAVRRAAVLSQIPQTYSLNVTGTSADSLEGYKVSSSGAATFSGEFNVARTFSITVNGVPAQAFYRNAGDNDAGTWRLAVPAGGGQVLRPGLNKVVVRFWDTPGGTGTVLEEFVAHVLYDVAGGTPVSGSLSSPGSLSLLAPASYVPGVPMLVRVDLKDEDGNLNRAAWNTTVNLTATNGVALNPATVTLTNGMGSALVTVGGTGSGSTVDFLKYGSGGSGGSGADSGTPGSVWRARTDFTETSLAAFITADGNTWKNENYNDTSWATIATQTGYGDDDENRAFTRVDYNPDDGGTQSGPVGLFRNTFTIADPAGFSAVAGEVKFDDSCAIYVNGTEVYRHGDLTANAPLTEYTETTTNSTRENATASFTIPMGLVKAGVNVIAVEVHQHDADSSDVTFDLRLQGTAFSSTGDPGNFSLTAATGGMAATKALTSLGTAAGTSVSGTLPAGITNWSGVVRVTGDVTVPAGATLNIAAGTHVLMNGTSGAGDTSGADLIVSGGTVNAAGTAANPISITSHSATTRWGEINTGGAATVWNHCLISRAGHSPGGGHTGTGPCFRLGDGAVWTFDDGVIADLSGKTLTNSGNTTMTMRRSHFGRCVMGPETDGSGITIEDCNFTDMLPAYRESGGPDDEDNIYIHDSGGRPVNLRRSVFAYCGDDALDLLGGSLTVEDCIVRNAFDKGISLLDNDVAVRRTQVIDCDIGVSTKCMVAAEDEPFLNVFENCTIVSENHPANTSDGDFHSIGIHTRNKYGTDTMQITVQVKNCIISAEQPVANDYGTAGNPFPLNVTSYTCFHDLGGANPANPVPAGTGVISGNPLYVSAAARDFRLAAGSPAINTGDPATTDPDGSRADMGALPTGIAGGGGGGGGEVHWTAAGSPYRVTANTTVPAGITLRIDPGVSVYFAQNVRFTVNGRILAEGTPGARIVFSHIPGTNVLTDVDPVKLGTQTGAPKWGGIRVVDSMAEESVFRYCDFINAQGTDPATSENYGSVGFIRSWGRVDHLTFAGTHLRMCYGRNCKLTVTNCVFPDMFIFDPVLNRIENPIDDFVAAADNRMEPLKVEYPTSDPEVSGANAANFPNGLPRDGHFRVYYNSFHGNRGHQDVFDGDSGRWGQPGQFLLDCRFNHFYGLAGDEHIDLGGDAYIASNVFENGKKDFWTNDTGYSNAISSGDKGDGTTIMVARNVCYDLDHVINCKAGTATIFEHNTVANFHADFQFTGATVTQNVVCAPINFFIPGDGPDPTVGDGAYLGYNLVSNVPHLFSGIDANAAGNGVTTKIEFFHNLLDQIADPVIGPNHPGGFFSGTYGPNTPGAPGFTDPANEDYTLRPESQARGTAPGGLDYGATVEEWAYVLGGPSGTVAQTEAAFTVGGPGIVRYKWRLDGGAWSAPVQIGSGGLLPRNAPAVRQATLTLTSLSAGAHTLEVLGQDMAGNWQDADPARSIAGFPQAAATSRTWTVNTALPLLVLNEITGDGVSPGPAGQRIGLVNRSAAALALDGWSLGDSPQAPGSQPLSGSLAAGAESDTALTAFRIDNRNGGAVYLFDSAGTVRDSLVFGPLPAGFSLGCAGDAAAWTLTDPTPAIAANKAARTGDPSGVYINEWLTAGGLRFNDDWVELANPSPLPVSISGLVLTDNLRGILSPFPPLSFIGGNGFLKVTADGNPEDGATHLPFQLDGTTGEIILVSSAGTEQDYVRYFAQIEDASQGLDSSGGFAYYALPTGGVINGTAAPGYANALAILNGLRITEIMYAPAGGNDFEFIELTNTGATPLDLSGVEFYDGIDFIFPAGFTLAPGGQTVLVRNPATFQSRYGSGLNVAGQYSGSLDNNGEQLALRLPAPWDANVLDFRYQSTWHNTTGSGLSLNLAANGTPAADFGEKTSWTTGPQGGTPAGGSLPAGGLNAWLAAYGLTMGDLTLDADRDGLSNLMEYALQTNPVMSGAGNGIDVAPVAQPGTINGNAVPALRASFPVTSQPGGFGNPGVTYFVQDSADLNNWRDLLRKSPADNGWQNVSGTALTLAEAAGVSGGRAGFILKSPDAIATSPRRHLRLRVAVTP